MLPLLLPCVVAARSAFSGVPYYPANYLSPSFGSSVVGVPVTFTMTVAHQDGPANLQFLQLLVNGPLSGGGGCYLMYDRVILAYPDPASGSGWLVPGSPQTAYNARVRCMRAVRARRPAAIP